MHRGVEGVFSTGVFFSVLVGRATLAICSSVSTWGSRGCFHDSEWFVSFFFFFLEVFGFYSVRGFADGLLRIYTMDGWMYMV
jgi:hypothetical protein